MTHFIIALVLLCFNPIVANLTTSNSKIGYRTKKAMKNKKTGSLHKKEVDYILRSLVFCFLSLLRISYYTNLQEKLSHSIFCTIIYIQELKKSLNISKKQ